MELGDLGRVARTERKSKTMAGQVDSGQKNQEQIPDNALGWQVQEACASQESPGS